MLTMPIEQLQLLDLPSSRVLRDLSADQWWTPIALAREMVRLADVQQGDFALEPSAGRGNIVQALAEAGADILAHELDPRWAAHLRQNAKHTHVHVIEGDYLASPASGQRFDQAVINPPYADGLDALFLVKALEEARVVVALLRIAALCGQERYRIVWQKYAGRCRSIHPLTIRPDFTGGDQSPGERSGAKSDFVVLVFGAEDLGERAPLKHLVGRYVGGEA